MTRRRSARIPRAQSRAAAARSGTRSSHHRVWLHPERGGHDYFRAFATYPEALAFVETTGGKPDLCVLIRHHEYIAEPSPGNLQSHKKELCATRNGEVEWLKRPRAVTPQTIPDFLACRKVRRLIGLEFCAA